jgi:hypothetical protein
LLITIGVLAPAAHISSSCISNSPWDDVAVYALAPAMDADINAAMALCSLSTFTNWAFISPEETSVAIFSTIDVWGVIG